MKLSRKSLPSLLSVFAALGVIGTSVLAVKATPKALNDISESDAENNKEKFLAAWKNYIPAALSGSFTIACIFSANGLNKKQQDAIMAAYAALNRSYSSYKGKVIERHGMEEHREIMKEINAERANKNTTIWAEGLVENTTLEFCVDEEEHLFYDVLGERFFTSTIGRVLQAEYHINRTYIIRSDATVNEFYNFLGIEPLDKFKDSGWSIGEDGIYWIDFSNYTSKVDDIDCMIIEPVFYPSTDYAACYYDR